ncbi:glycosyltransferase family 2 protein [Roseovarius sp. M141]|uniref:glycosyltransferase family 2 protein n=1 Tax=Roseovarius sp. M141 TaxID=2583806 RepID=UPI0020CCFACE|nr:glycosyltransferase family 2 protein [Roseovarius sp. M141]MCQ0090479.1 glycosyltransferase family 2 protein [Roseovarius sp. M141]
MTNIKISVVSPIYGCRDCLHTLADQVADTFADTDFDWELLLVDDRGPDQPWEVITELAQNSPHIRGVRLARNHGQHLAIWAGLEAANGDYVVVIDCDLQDDPKIIPALLEKLIHSNVDAVVVDRGTWSDSKLRRIASKSFYAVVKSLTGVSINNIGNFGIYSRRLVDILLMYQEQEVFLPIMVSLTGLPTTQLQVDRGVRLAGESSYSLRRLITMAIAIIIRFTDRPLKLSVIIGLAFSSLSALISLLLLLMWLLGSFTVPGWTSTILSMWFLSGLIMATLGVHGFYLGRIFREVQGRPRILIEQTTDKAGPPA